MKQLILLLFPLLMFSQSNVSLGVYIDPKLTFFGDGKHYDATLDFKIELEMQGKQIGYGYFSIKAQYENAQLRPQFTSWLIAPGWTFNELVVKNTSIGIFPTVGFINRFGEGFFTYGATGEISYKIGRISLSLQCQAIDRPDVPKFGLSNYLGIKYDIK